LRKPSGFVGRVVVSRFLNWGNAPMNRLTLELLALEPDDDVIEIGLRRRRPHRSHGAIVTRGRIAGVDFSAEMVEVCQKRFRALIRDGRLEHRCASVERLP